VLLKNKTLPKILYKEARNALTVGRTWCIMHSETQHNTRNTKVNWILSVNRGKHKPQNHRTD